MERDDNSNLKKEFPRTLENTLSSVQRLSDSDVEVDIIAVQGLASSYEWTWSIEQEDGTRYYWLRELLPKNLQKPRILAFEYNSNWYKNPAHITLDDCGKRLLECLVDDRTHRGHTQICGARRKRPILFVGHSFGGLVIKQALVIASQTHHEEPRYADYRDILYATAGVIFLATPHRGSSFSAAARLKMQAGRLFGVQTYPELVSILDIGSPTLNTLQQNFQKILSRSLLADLQLFCFYEELPLALGLVVKAESACIGIGGSQSLEANHMEMNKFGPEGRNHKNYLAFEAQLLEMYNRGKEIVGRRFAAMQYGNPHAGVSLSDIRDWLRPSQSPQLTRLRNLQVERRHTPTTCHWIFQTEDYVKWKNSAFDHNCLWIHGKAGSGKSVLAAFLVSMLSGNDLRRKNSSSLLPSSCLHQLDTDHCDYDRQRLYTPTTLYFFTVDAAIPEAIILLGTLIHQLLRKFDEDRKLIAMVEQFARNFTEPSEDLLVMLLKDLAEVIGSLYIIVDGLDESSDLKSVLQLLSKLCTSQAIRIIVLSQFDQLISSMLGPDCLSLDMTLHSHSDIHDFIKQQTSELIRSKPLLESEKTSISERILARSDGMFQWVSLIMHDLSYAVTVRDVDRCLEEFPHKLNSTYAGILYRLFLKSPNWWPRVKTALRWLATGARPLTIQELWLAIALHEGDQDLVQRMLNAQGSDHTFDDNEIENHFRALLGPLVKITNLETEADLVKPPRVIQLCHSSLSQLLLSGEDLIFRESTNRSLSNPCPPKHLAHAHCAEACLDLCASGLITFVDSYAVPHDVPMLGYFWHYCIYHLQHSAPLYATSDLPNKLDHMLANMVDNTLILLDCIYEILCRPPDDNEFLSSTPSARRARAATMMDKAVALKTALESIPPAVEALLALKQFLPVGEKLAQAAKASNIQELGSTVCNPVGLTGWLKHTYHKLNVRYHGVGNATSSFLRLALEDAIDDWPVLLPTHLAYTKPLATAIKSLQKVTLSIVADPIYPRLTRIKNKDFGPVPGLVSRAMVLEGMINLPYEEFFRMRNRPLQDFRSSHFDCHSSDMFYGEIGMIRLSLGSAARSSPVLQEPIPRRQHISYGHYVIITGLLSLQGSQFFGLDNVFINHWLKHTALMPIEHGGFRNPALNLEIALRQDGYFERVRWNMSDFIASIPALFTIWVVKLLQLVLERLGPHTEHILQFYVLALKFTWSKLVHSYSIMYEFGLGYGLASSLLYLFRYRYFPSMGAAMYPFPDLVEALKDLWRYHLPGIDWLHPAPTRYFAALMCHTGVRYMAEALAPPKDVWMTPQSWRNRILYVYIGFCHLTRMERVICHMAIILTKTFIYVGRLLVFDDTEMDLSEPVLYGLTYIAIAIPMVFFSIAAVDSKNRKNIIFWLPFWLAYFYYMDRLVSLVQWVSLWFLQPIITPLYSLLSVLVDMRSLGILALALTALWAYSHIGTLMSDPYNFAKAHNSSARARILIRKHINEERLNASKQKILNRHHVHEPPSPTDRPVAWGTPIPILRIPPAAIQAPVLPRTQHSVASGEGSGPPSQASVIPVSTSIPLSPSPASLFPPTKRNSPFTFPPPLPGKASIRAAIEEAQSAVNNPSDSFFAGMTRGFLVSRRRNKRATPQLEGHIDPNIAAIEVDQVGQVSQIKGAGELRYRRTFVHNMDSITIAKKAR